MIYFFYVIGFLIPQILIFPGLAFTSQDTPQSIDYVTNSKSCNEYLGGQYAFEKLLEGKTLYREEDPFFSLSEQAVWDLEINKIVAPQYLKYISTSLGGRRLNWLLKNPYMSVPMIQERQRAMLALANADEMTVKVFEESWRRLAGVERYIDFAETVVTYEDKVRPDFVTGGMISVVYGSALSGVGSAYLLDSPDKLLLPFLSYMFFGVNSLKPIFQQSQRILDFKAMMGFVETSIPLLQQVPSYRLIEIKDVFSRIHKKGHILNKIYKLLKRVQVGWKRKALDVSMLSFLTLYLSEKNLRKASVELAELLSAIAELDVYWGLSRMYVQNKDKMTIPVIRSSEAGNTFISIREGMHPYLFFNKFDESVASSLSLNSSSDESVRLGLNRFALITGPNERGKSTFLRNIGIFTLIAQLGGPVPALSVELTPVALLTNFRNLDSLADGESTFYNQAKQIQDMLDKMKTLNHVLVILDEVCTGTSPEEHLAAEHAIIEALLETNHLVLLATHNRKLAQLNWDGLKNFHMSDSDERDRKYKLELGPSQRRNAFEVMQRAGLSAHVVERAKALYEQSYKLLEPGEVSTTAKAE